jgi:hypothetical protein
VGLETPPNLDDVLTVPTFFLFLLYQTPTTTTTKKLGDFLVQEYTAEQLRQYMCFYDESKVDILSLATVVADLAFRIIEDAGEHPFQWVEHGAKLLMPLTTNELKESANAQGLSEDGSKVDIILRLTEHFHKYKFMPKQQPQQE